MTRVAALSVAGFAAALLGTSGLASAEPMSPADDTVFAIGKCYDGIAPPVQRPARFAYNCDVTGVMEDMTWSAWGADGARGTGIDSAIECQPNCAQGARLSNPIVVHAWNPVSATTAGCPSDAQFYSDLTIGYPHGVPPWIVPGTTWDDGTEFLTVDGMPAVKYSGLTPTCAAA